MLPDKQVFRKSVSGWLLHNFPRLPGSTPAGRATPSRQLQAVKQPLPLPCPPSVLTLLVSKVSLSPKQHLENLMGLEVGGQGSLAVPALGVYGVTNGLACW